MAINSIVSKRVGVTWLWVAVLFLFVNAVSVMAQDMPEALEGIAIQDTYFPSQFREVGKIERAVGEGRVVILRRAEGKAFFAVPGDPVHENDAVYTLGTIRCRIVFEDRNLVTLAPRSDLIVDEVTLDGLAGQKRSRFEVTMGRAVFYAIPLFRYRDVRLNVKTPTATVGVRGTKFGTEIEKAPFHGGIPAANRFASKEPVLQAASLPEDILTRIYVAMGRVNVTSEADGTSRDLGENEILEADALGLGPTRFDPDLVRSFMDVVEGPIVSGEEPTDPSPTRSAPSEDSPMQRHEDMIRQLEQAEDAKGFEIQREIEMRHIEPSGKPMEPPASPPCGDICP